MKTTEKLLALIVVGCMIAIGLSYWRPGEAPAVQDTVFVTETRAIAETTKTVVTRYRTRVDSIIRTDTARFVQIDTLFLRSLDTVFAQCERCALRLDSAATVIKAKGDTIAQLQRALRRSEKQKPWWALGGAVIGSWGACR